MLFFVPKPKQMPPIFQDNGVKVKLGALGSNAKGIHCVFWKV